MKFLIMLLCALSMYGQAASEYVVLPKNNGSAYIGSGTIVWYPITNVPTNTVTLRPSNPNPSAVIDITLPDITTPLGGLLASGQTWTGQNSFTNGSNSFSGNSASFSSATISSLAFGSAAGSGLTVASGSTFVAVGPTSVVVWNGGLPQARLSGNTVIASSGSFSSVSTSSLSTSSCTGCVPSQTFGPCGAGTWMIALSMSSTGVITGSCGP